MTATARWLHWTAIPLGSLPGGALATIVGLRATIAIGATIATFSAVWLLISPIRRLREMPRVSPIESSIENPLDEASLPLGQSPT